jgi:ASC-1-like (ASCH) protein
MNTKENISENIEEIQIYKHTTFWTYRLDDLFWNQCMKNFEKKHFFLSSFKKNLIKKDDIVKFENNKDNIKAIIKKIVNYDSFEEYLSTEGLSKTLPGIKTIADGIAIYRQFYTEQQERQGVLAIHFKLIQ